MKGRTLKGECCEIVVGVGVVVISGMLTGASVDGGSYATSVAHWGPQMAQAPLITSIQTQDERSICGDSDTTNQSTLVNNHDERVAIPVQ